MKLTKHQRHQLEQASRIGKPVKFVYPGSGKELMGIVVDEVCNYTENYKNVLQKIETDLEYHDGSTHLYRFGYYVYSFKAQGVRWSQRPLVVTSKQCQD